MDGVEEHVGLYRYLLEPLSPICVSVFEWKHWSYGVVAGLKSLFWPAHHSTSLGVLWTFGVIVDQVVDRQVGDYYSLLLRIHCVLWPRRTKRHPCWLVLLSWKETVVSDHWNGPATRNEIIR